MTDTLRRIDNPDGAVELSITCVSFALIWIILAVGLPKAGSHAPLMPPGATPLHTTRVLPLSPPPLAPRLAATARAATRAAARAAVPVGAAVVAGRAAPCGRLGRRFCRVSAAAAPVKKVGV